MMGKAICPVCGQGDEVNKVSAIYIKALEAKRPAPKPQPVSAGPVFTNETIKLKGIPDSELSALGKRLAPPALPKKAPTRPLHPDQVVLVFSLLLPVFLAGIASSQPQMLIPILVLLGGCYGVYLYKRRDAINKFERLRAAQHAENDRVQRGIGRWMNLQYCARDDAVFEAGSSDSSPADLIAGYLFRD